MHITFPMFEKGRSFVMAGGLVKAYEGHKFVYLHLVCQGIECIGKALLLSRNYEKFEQKLKGDYGHDLELLINEINEGSTEALFSKEAMKELKILNSYYKQHMLRYGAASDFKVEAQYITADCLHRELIECLAELNTKFASIESP
ncbi:hypothetical protein [Sedimenticola selenatireducens]|uniref:HEPN domain-containing protein n=2 Tax=Sedimenticola TaxID=349742 RepID=A0A558CXA0_9GAMM|nr:hypothetical protein [Sedimenticola selenatireducens]TVO69722.1 hypothetical protein FHP88_17850 [Sedimenticola selenatireducens]TVT53372.1 MAG: hypothetical protein FHK82_12010 [Sedimenticola thiotaurini]TVT62210.1 MAG: hypothetical protein FHK78_15200 [Sedimenticola selenatireducens]